MCDALGGGMGSPLRTVTVHLRRSSSLSPADTVAIAVDGGSGVDLARVRLALGLDPASVRPNGYFLSRGPGHVCSAVAWRALLAFFAKRGLPTGADASAPVVVHGKPTAPTVPGSERGSPSRRSWADQVEEEEASAGTAAGQLPPLAAAAHAAHVLSSSYLNPDAEPFCASPGGRIHFSDSDSSLSGSDQSQLSAIGKAPAVAARNNGRRREPPSGFMAAARRVSEIQRPQAPRLRSVVVHPARLSLPADGEGFRAVESRRRWRRQAAPVRPRPVPGNLVGRCFNCLSTNHVRAACTSPARCFTCFGEGHQARDCPIAAAGRWTGKRGRPPLRSQPAQRPSRRRRNPLPRPPSASSSPRSAASGHAVHTHVQDPAPPGNNIHAQDLVPPLNNGAPVDAPAAPLPANAAEAEDSVDASAWPGLDNADGNGGRPRTTRFGGAGDPRLGCGAWPSFRRRQQAVVVVGSFACPVVSPADRHGCSRESGMLQPGLRTGGSPSLDTEVDLGRACSRSPVTLPSLDPMLCEAGMPGVACQVPSRHGESQELGNTVSDRFCGHGFVGSVILDDPLLLSGAGAMEGRGPVHVNRPSPSVSSPIGPSGVAQQQDGGSPILHLATTEPETFSPSEQQSEVQANGASPAEHAAQVLSQEDRSKSFFSKLVKPLSQPLITSTPSLRVTKTARRAIAADGEEDWVPRRSARLVAKSKFREARLEKQARKVLMRKLGFDKTTDKPDVASFQEFQEMFAAPLSESKLEALRALFPARNGARTRRESRI